VSKEKLLKVWNDVARKTGLKVNYGEQVETIKQFRIRDPDDPWFL